MNLHWIEDEDEQGFPMWDRYIACSHWGLFFTERQVRFVPPILMPWGRGEPTG